MSKHAFSHGTPKTRSFQAPIVKHGHDHAEPEDFMLSLIDYALAADPLEQPRAYKPLFHSPTDPSLDD